MTVLISGGSGLVGRALAPLLQTQGHGVRRLVRRTPATEAEIFWNPERGELDAANLAGVDAVVHLSGENIAGGRWTAARKTAILRSRVDSTRTLVAALGRMEHKPTVIIGASATGIYGDRGDEWLTENSPTGQGFLAQVCDAWERELGAAKAAGIRTVALRTGVVLTPAGGALAKMLPAFLAGAGGRLGSGQQWLSWIALDDLLGAMLHVLYTPDCEGAINAVAPQPETNATFSAILGRVLHRPAALPVPALALRALFGELADATFLASARVSPTCLAATHYAFRFAELEAALRHLLGRYPT